MPTVLLAERMCPIEPIEAYVRHLRLRRIKDIQAYEWERCRLHNAIFNAAGLANLGKEQRESARQIGYFARDSDMCKDLFEGINITPYGKFDRELESLLCDVLACPTCGYTPNRDMSCTRCDKFVTVEDNLKTLRGKAQ